MRAEIKSWQWCDDPAADAYTPTDLHEFDAAVEVEIGPQGKQGADLFQFSICSGGTGDASAVFVGQELRLEAWPDSVRARDVVEQWVEAIEAGSWTEIVGRLREHMQWEFEGMPADGTWPQP